MLTAGMGSVLFFVNGVDLNVVVCIIIESYMAHRKKRKTRSTRKRQATKTKTKTKVKTKSKRSPGRTPFIGTRISKEKLVEIIYACSGIVRDVAATTKIGRRTILRWKAEKEWVGEAFKDAGEDLIDLAEGKLKQAIRAGEAWAICFYMKCRAKHRGYIERLQLGGQLGQDITINVGKKGGKKGKEIADNIN